MLGYLTYFNLNVITVCKQIKNLRMSAEIHNTIAIFCKLLNVVYGTNLKPEYFRLAKFNKTDENVERILWNALYKISEENNRTSLFETFLKHNYVRKEFYTLKEGNCSRELLLALIYYLSTRLETDIQNKLNYNHEFSDIILRQGDGYYNETCRYSQFNWRKLNERDFENYKKWLCGKIVSNNNMISEYNEQINKIQEKYNKQFDMKAHGKLTVYEILALKNKTISERFLHDTDAVVQILIFYTEWIKKEKIFWKWMNTVLEEAKRKRAGS